jgi:hypothetical protein
MTDHPLPPLLAAARAIEMDRDASTGASAEYLRGMTRAIALLALLHCEEEPEAHPPHDNWLVEWREQGGDWNVAYPTSDHGRALDRLARGRADSPEWQWRLVRDRTIYTVVPEPGEEVDDTDLTEGDIDRMLAEAEPTVEPYCDGFPDTCPNKIEVVPAPPHHGGGVRCGCYDDTLPQWLYQRFACPGQPTARIAWDLLEDNIRSYWKHTAAAVRRAVARDGFKEPS